MKPKPISLRARLRDRLIERLVDWRRRGVERTAVVDGLQLLWPRSYKIPCAYSWMDPLFRALRRVAPVSVVDVPQEHAFGACVRFQVVVGGFAFDVALDFADRSEIDWELAGDCLVYFKMQFRGDGYPLANVLPGGYVVAHRRTYLDLPRLRRLRDRGDFLHDVCGRFGLQSGRLATGYRRRALDLLRDAGYALFADPYRTVPQGEFMSEIARSRVCVDLPGTGNLCFRLVEYLSVGACVVAPRHTNRLVEPLVDRKHIVYAEPDLSDLVELCEYYLRHDDEREAIARNGRAYFDRYLHRDRLVRYYLEACVERIDAAVSDAVDGEPADAGMTPAPGPPEAVPAFDYAAPVPFAAAGTDREPA